MTVEVKIECEIPTVPNFLKTSSGVVPLYAITEEALRQLGAAWTEMLVERARHLKMASTNQ